MAATSPSQRPDAPRPGSRPPGPLRVPRLLLAVARPFRAFFRMQAAGGIVLVVNAVLALLWANSRFGESYARLLELPLSIGVGGDGVAWPLRYWINDALMSAFFLVAGMEIKRELVVGELSSVRRATLPAIAALGGMLAPAAIHFAINRGGPAQHGWGIPMATDIAFALGCLALVARRVPSSIVVFLMALAIFDDLGAILVIALFYGHGVKLAALAVAALFAGALLLLHQLRVGRVWPYLVLGLGLWVAVHESGVHATVAGVILGLTIPARGQRQPRDVLDDLSRSVAELRARTEQDLAGAGPLAAIERHLESVQPPLDRMLHGLHGVVAFGIVPLFAIANAGVALRADVGATIASAPALGAALGLVIGKPVGVFGATWLATRFGFAPRPTGASALHLFGASLLAGIGFTMSIFVATLAFPGDRGLEDASKLGILAGSLLSALLGIGLLRFGSAPQTGKEEDSADIAILDLPRFAEGFRVEPWRAEGPLVGKTLADAALRARHGVTVLGALPTQPAARASQLMDGLLPVGADHVIASGETLVIVGASDAVTAFVRAQEPQSSLEAAPEN